MRCAGKACLRFAPCFGSALLALFLAATAPGDTSPPASAIELRLPADIVYSSTVRADSAVIFSHQTHVQFAGNRCTGCHPAVFPMLKRGPAPTHLAMNAGQSCGRCHDDKQAFSVRDSAACGTCHSGPRPAAVAAAGKEPGGAAESPRVPRPHTYPASDASPGPVTFRHQTHAGGTKGCVACHPKPFRMAAAAPLPDGGMHEAKACGACHDGKQAFGAEDPESCMRCHHENGAAP